MTHDDIQNMIRGEVNTYLNQELSQQQDISTITTTSPPPPAANAVTIDEIKNLIQ